MNEDRTAVFKQIFLFEMAQYRTRTSTVDIQPKLTESHSLSVCNCSINRRVPPVFVLPFFPFYHGKGCFTDSYNLFDLNVMRMNEDGWHKKFVGLLHTAHLRE